MLSVAGRRNLLGFCYSFAGGREKLLDWQVFARFSCPHNSSRGCKEMIRIHSSFAVARKAERYLSKYKNLGSSFTLTTQKQADLHLLIKKINLSKFSEESFPHFI